MPPLKDITGMRFDRLVALSLHGRERFGRAIWLCKCDCGRGIIASSSNLMRGNTKSCGCLRDEKRIDNGHNRCEWADYYTQNQNREFGRNHL
jgi:hypothetical protein